MLLYPGFHSKDGERLQERNVGPFLGFSLGWSDVLWILARWWEPFSSVWER